MQTLIVKLIVKLYFIGALAYSFENIVSGAHLIGLHGMGKDYTAPLVVDGLAVIGMIMRGKKWSDETNKLGFKVQMIMGSISLLINVAAGQTIGLRIHGATMVILFLFAEWLGGKMETRQAAEAKAQVAELEAIASLPSAEELAAQARRDRALRAAVTRKKNAARKERERKAQERALEALVA